MVITEKALRRLAPPGKAFRFPGTIGQVISAITLSTERLRTFFLQILTEAIPHTAVITIPAWFQTLGLHYDPTFALSDLQARADAAWSQTGGQSLNYLNAQIQKECPQVYLQEILFPGGSNFDPGTAGRTGVGRIGLERLSCAEPTMSYQVQGTVTDRPHYNRLLAILARIAPLHLVPIILLTILSEQAVARCGIEQVGSARIGKGS